MIFKIYARKYKFKGLRYGEILFVYNRIVIIL